MKKMKATGVVRRIDELGRIVIPREIRRTLHIHVGDPLEIFIDDDGSVTFKKFFPLGEEEEDEEEEEEIEDRYTLDDLGSNWY